MSRLDILTNKDVYKETYPEKATLVVNHSLAELVLLYLGVRPDIDWYVFNTCKTPETLHTKIIKWLGESYVVDDKVGIIEGVIHYHRSWTLEDSTLLYNLLNNATKFQHALFNAHNIALKKFITVSKSNLCGNVLLHCSDEIFDAVMRSIDFPFTTIDNVLTALRADLVYNTDTYGKIRTPRDLFIVNLKESQEDCVGVYASNLQKG